MTVTWTTLLASEADTLALGQALSTAMPQGCIVYLVGNLGAGKTTLMRGVLRGLGYEGKVKSPTYTLVEPYTLADKQIYHFDLYRLSDPRALVSLGMSDYLDGHAVCWIEWPEKGEGFLPAADLICHLKTAGDGREAMLTAKTGLGELWLEGLTRPRE